jgi:tetratricopeptide (TPR) repeat protein
MALWEARRFEEAITACQDAAAIFRETGDRHGEGGALNNLGNALQEARRLAEAITAYQDALAIYRETGDQYREGITLRNLETARPRSSPDADECGWAAGPLRRYCAQLQGLVV